MKKFILLFIGSCWFVQLFSQFSGGNSDMMKQLSTIGHVYGKIVDSLGKTVEGASVVLLQPKVDAATHKWKDVLLKASVTTASGEFDFNQLPVLGILKLKITTVGFKPFEQSITFKFNMNGVTGAPSTDATPQQQIKALSGVLNSFDKDLGNIKLSPEDNTLQGVTVSGVRTSSMKLDIDKKVFNVEKNIVSAGGTAVDVMRNVPSVQIDIDGNVKLRNATPQIYIDGRPTSLTLDQIPADAIESVEVITNPSAKYDASGGNAGILNIVLKSNKKAGYNGNLTAGVDSRGALNGGGNLNVRQGKFNVSLAGLANQQKNKTTGFVDQTNLTDTVVHLFQNNLNRMGGGFAFGRLGIDYFINNRTTISLAGILVHGNFKPYGKNDIYTDSLFNSGTKSIYSERVSNSERKFDATGVQFGLKHNFPKAGEEWTADANYFSGKSSGDALIATNNYTRTGNFLNTSLQHDISGGNNAFLTLQTDYVKPFANKNKTTLETGLRMQLQHLTNNNDTYIGSNVNNYVKISDATSNFKTNQYVYAAYASIKSSINSFAYEAGLRAESSNYTGNLTNTGEKFSNDYPISLFPSLFLSQKLKEKQELQFSYTRRINRPSFFNSIPYTDRTDILNVTKGNPDLVPEFTNSFEASYSKTFKKNDNLLFSIYYKQTNNLITRYLSDEVDQITGSFITTWINANSSNTYGAELTSINYLAKWWDISTNLNLYQSKVDISDVTKTASPDAILSWFGKFNSNFKLPKNFTVQLSAEYQSKTNLPINSSGNNIFGGSNALVQSSSQGYIRPFWGADIAIRKSFLKSNAAMVTLSVTDIFATRKQDQHSQSDYFVQDYYRINNPQLIKLNFTYRFGKLDLSLFKRQNLNSQIDGMQNAAKSIQ